MKLFTMGPVQMPEDVLHIGSEQLPYFRTEEFSDTNRRVCENIKFLIGAEQADDVYLLTCSGSGAMEATITSCFDDKDKLFIINGGTFGQRFSDLCSIHKIPYAECKVELEETLTYEKLESEFDEECNALVVNMHETSNGKLYDMDMLAQFCKKKGLYFVVDAISSFLADDISFQTWQMDIAILSSQKGMALSPGLSVVVGSKRIVEKMRTVIPISLYFNLELYAKNMERGQTPFTPAVGIILQMDKRLSQIRKNGIDKQIQEIADRANYFRKRAMENGINIPKYPLSNALTPVLFEEQASYIYQKLVKEKNIYVTPSGGILKNRLLRVGHLGSLAYEDYDELLSAMVLYMEK